MKMKRTWWIVSAFVVFSIAAGALVLRPHNSADLCCPAKGSLRAPQKGAAPMAGQMNGQLPPGHPDISEALPPGHPDVNGAMQAKPLSPEQLAQSGECPYLSKMKPGPGKIKS